MQTKTRVLPGFKVSDPVTVQGTLTEWHEYSSTGFQKTVDEITNFPASRRLLKSNKVNARYKKAVRSQDYGGEFTSETWFPVPTPTPGPSVDALAEYSGHWSALSGDHDATVETRRSRWQGVDPIDEAGLWAKGGTAISRCAPTNPHAGVYTMMGELKRDGLPLLPMLDAWKKKTLRPDQLGSEYLNVEFGLKPFLSDLGKLYKATKNAEAILQQYMRDSGRVVRRGYSFPVVNESTREVQLNSVHTPSLSYLHYGTSSYRVMTRSIETETWFKGAFTYHVDREVYNGLSAELQKINHLYNILPSIGNSWNLMPWSWAFDWFANTGDVMNNLSMLQNDGLVMVYGYLMEKKTISTEYAIYGDRTKNGAVIFSPTEFRYTRKLRRRASPFGFGLTFEDFSPRQIAIMAALGFSQSGRYMAK